MSTALQISYTANDSIISLSYVEISSVALAMQREREGKKPFNPSEPDTYILNAQTQDIYISNGI